MFIFYCDEFYITIKIIRNELFTLYIKISLFSKMKVKYSTDILKVSQILAQMPIFKKGVKFENW